MNYVTNTFNNYYTPNSNFLGSPMANPMMSNTLIPQTLPGGMSAAASGDLSALLGNPFINSPGIMGQGLGGATISNYNITQNYGMQGGFNMQGFGMPGMMQGFGMPGMMPGMMMPPMMPMMPAPMMMPPMGSSPYGGGGQDGFMGATMNLLQNLIDKLTNWSGNDSGSGSYDSGSETHNHRHHRGSGDRTVVHIVRTPSAGTPGVTVVSGTPNVTVTTTTTASPDPTSTGTTPTGTTPTGTTPTGTTPTGTTPTGTTPTGTTPTGTTPTGTTPTGTTPTGTTPTGTTPTGTTPTGTTPTGTTPTGTTPTGTTPTGTTPTRAHGDIHLETGINPDRLNDALLRASRHPSTPADPSDAAADTPADSTDASPADASGSDSTRRRDARRPAIGHRATGHSTGSGSAGIRPIEELRIPVIDPAEVLRHPFPEPDPTSLRESINPEGLHQAEIHTPDTPVLTPDLHI